MDKIMISGFADEIAISFDEQLKTVTQLGMKHISLRSANMKSISDFTVSTVQSELLPMLNQYGVKVSSIGSPIGKVKVGDEDGFNKQLSQLKELCEICKLLDCKYIRMFSFYIPEGVSANECRDEIMNKLSQFVKIAEQEKIILIHENEKEIYGDTAARCHDILNTIKSPYLKAAFDYANFVQCDEDTEAAWELLKDEVVYIHIKDAVYASNENVLCGTGDGKIEMLLTCAIKNGYEGFLTLEPHLVLFEALQSLETGDAKDIIKENKAKTGAEAYKMQYEALTNILNKI